MDVIRKLPVNAPSQRLWKILAEDYVDVGLWTSQIEQSSPNPDLPYGEGRVCAAPGFGDIKETITEFDETRRKFSYAAEISSFPFFVKGVSNTWRVEADGAERSIVHMHIKVELMPVFSLFMGPVMRRQMAKTGDILLEELKHYAETGQIHPRALAQNAQLAAA